jgi:hypothetical protein
MKGHFTLFLDQYGNRFYSRTVRELREQVPGRLSKMYRDTTSGTRHVGYVIGQHWLTAFQPVELPA